MPRIAILNCDEALQAARATLDAVHARLGTVSNLFRRLALNPHALGGYMGQPQPPATPRAA